MKCLLALILVSNILLANSTAYAANLFDAVSQGDVIGIKQLLEQGEDINASNAKGSTPLDIAVEEGKIGIALLLIEKGAFCNESHVRRAKLQGYSELSEILANYLLGNTKLSRNDYQGAIASYSEAIRLSPNFARAHWGRGLAIKATATEEHAYYRALSDFDAAISSNPKNARYYYSRANAKTFVDDWKGAVKDYDKAIALDPGNSEYREKREAAMNADNAVRARDNELQAESTRKLFGAAVQLGAVLGATAAQSQAQTAQVNAAMANRSAATGRYPDNGDINCKAQDVEACANQCYASSGCYEGGGGGGSDCLLGGACVHGCPLKLGCYPVGSPKYVEHQRAAQQARQQAAQLRGNGGGGYSPNNRPTGNNTQSGNTAQTPKEACESKKNYTYCESWTKHPGACLYMHPNQAWDPCRE